MVTLRDRGRFFVCPAAYLASVVPATVITLILTVFMEDTIYSYLYPFEGDFGTYGYLAQTLSLLIIAVPIYGLLGPLLYRLEEISRPRLLDHLRHCVLLYGLLLAGLVVTTLSYQRELAAGYTQPAGPGASVILWVTGCAILMNLLALLWRRSRSDGSGDEL